MPEYLALTHFREQAPEGEEMTPPSVDEIESMFSRMEADGIAKVVH